jgi:tRNA dimethylallyltransferase
VATKQPKPLVVIVGETASGKSDLAITLAKRFTGEIICADAWTIRREANIGTSKPSISDQKEVPHHLLDIIEPNEKFSAADFKRLANESISKVSDKGRLPILVGGSGLYIDGLLYDYSFLPTSSSYSREDLNNLTAKDLIEIIKRHNYNIENLDSNNKRRLIRCIETSGQYPTKNEIRKNTLIIGLKTDQEVLKNRIINRVDKMLEDGLEAEVIVLEEKYGWGSEALRAINYSQWKDYFLGKENIDEVRKKLIKANLDFAKRQRTWFKRNKSIHWFTTPVKLNDVVELITTGLLT